MSELKIKRDFENKSIVGISKGKEGKLEIVHSRPDLLLFIGYTYLEVSAYIRRIINKELIWREFTSDLYHTVWLVKNIYDKDRLEILPVTKKSQKAKLLKKFVVIY